METKNGGASIGSRIVGLHLQIFTTMQMNLGILFSILENLDLSITATF
jgi:hypothetical protein